MEKKPEMTGVVGYIDKKGLEKFKSHIGKDGSTDLRFERKNDQILMRVKHKDIVDIIPGNDHEHESKVQVILKKGSSVETVVKMFRNVKEIDDPTLTRLTAVANVSVSFV